MKLAATLLLLCTSCIYAQTTAVSATVVDSSSTTWANGSWSLTFYPNPSNPNISVYNINGVPLSPAVLNQRGTLNGSGHFSFTGYQTGLINPSGSLLSLSVCPNATAPCGNYLFSTGTNSSLDISAALTSVIPVPKFQPISGTYGYNDAEAVIQLLPGSTYWNVTIGAQRCYTGSVWGACALSSGAGTGACPSNQYEIADTTGGPTCAQVAYSQISGTPAAGAGTGNCPSGQYETTDTVGGPTCAQVQYSQLGGSPPTGGTNVDVNGGSTLPTLHLNPGTPSPDAGNILAPFKISGANAIVEVPYTTTGNFGVSEPDNSSIDLNGSNQYEVKSGYVTSQQFIHPRTTGTCSGAGTSCSVEYWETSDGTIYNKIHITAQPNDNSYDSTTFGLAYTSTDYVMNCSMFRPGGNPGPVGVESISTTTFGILNNTGGTGTLPDYYCLIVGH